MEWDSLKKTLVGSVTHGKSMIWVKDEGAEFDEPFLSEWPVSHLWYGITVALLSVTGGKNYQCNLETIDPMPVQLAHWIHKEMQNKIQAKHTIPWLLL